MDRARDQALGARPGVRRERSHPAWQPTLGAWIEGTGVRFRVWAPETSVVEVVFDRLGPAPTTLEAFHDGTHGTWVPGVGAGARYTYRLDSGPALPDPASRCQPDGVHGASAVVDPSTFGWTDQGWAGATRADLVLYELHIGTFTPEGTFAAAARRLGHRDQRGLRRRPASGLR